MTTDAPAASSVEPSHSAGAAAAPGLAWAIAGAIFVSAFLLFQVQPLLGKFILPWFGGTPAVWTTAMLFFQMALFGGYTYAHLLSLIKNSRTQALIHISLLAVAILSLPIIPADRWKPSDSDYPETRILGLLALTVGLPYLVLSSSGPLLQAWFSRAFPGRSPYRLYALSNIGSLVALLSYPFFFEPRLELPPQAWLWSVGFVLFAMLAGWCAWNVGKIPMTSPHSTPTVSGTSLTWMDTWPGAIGLRVLWLALPCFASLTLLATTNHVCQDVASIPLMWVAPLSLYLVSFIICFDHPRWYVRELYAPFTLAMLILGAAHREVLPYLQQHWPSIHGWLLWALFNKDTEKLGFLQEVGVMFAAMFGVCMLCHGELVRLRPRPAKLTEYYLCISAGGALGGVLVSLVAPQVFQTYAEWNLMVIGGLALAVTAGFLCVTWQFTAMPPHWRALHIVLILPVMAAAAGGAWWLYQWRPTYGYASLYQARNFYGTVAVKEYADEFDRKYYCFVSGRIQHGIQFADPQERREPISYFGYETGVGKALAWGTSHLDGRIGVVGLGVGASAAYAKPGNYYRFYEINPEVVRIARDELPVTPEPGAKGEAAAVGQQKRFFYYLHECLAEYELVLGDGRLALEREPPQKFDVLCLDAFSSDAVPTHLLTREAFEIYLRHLKTQEKDGRDGIIVVNITNTYLDLEPVVLGLAEHFGLGYTRLKTHGNRETLEYVTDYMLLTHNRQFLADHPSSPRDKDEKELKDVKRLLWTDHYSNLFEILYK